MSAQDIVSAIADLNLGEMCHLGQYEDFMAEFYNRVASHNTYSTDCELFVQNLLIELPRHRQNRVLELCCGGGRLTLLLAKNGFLVDALDNSESMVQTLQYSLNRMKRIAANVRALVGDAVDGDYPGRYEAVVLNATSICLLGDYAALERMMRRIYDALEPGGVFLFDLRIIEENLSAGDYQPPAVQCFTWHNQEMGSKNFTLMQEVVDTDQSRFVTKIYGERITDVTERFVSSTEKRILSLSRLSEIYTRVGFRLKRQETFDFFQDGLPVVLIILEKPANVAGAS